MGKFKIIGNELFYEHGLGSVADFIKSILSSTDTNTDVLDLCRKLSNIVSGCAFEHLNTKELEQYLNSLNMFKEGYDIANRIMSADKGVHYFIKDRHLGDAARTFPLISVFKHYHLTNKTFPIDKIVVITTEPIASLGKLYPNIDEFIVLDKEELSDLVYFLNDCCSQTFNFYLDDFQITPAMKRKYLLPKNLSFAADMLRLPGQLRCETIRNAETILAEHNTVPSKTVILLPYSYTSSSIPEQYLAGAIEHFRCNGYTIFTNAGSEKEKTLNGTYRLNVTPDIVLALGNMGCLLIGAQSGLMDMQLWFRLNINCIIIFILNGYHDFWFAEHRKLTQRITYTETAAYIMLYPNEVDSLSDYVIQQFAYFDKGNKQLPIETISATVSNLFQISNLNDYIIALMQIEHIVIFISAYDSANTYWKDFQSRHLLGLKDDLSQKWRMSYVAVVDKDDDFVHECISDRSEGASFQYYFEDTLDVNTTCIEGMPSGNNCWLYSCGLDSQKYTKSSIWINGKDHSLSGRGLNIVVYSKTAATIIDSVTVDLFDDINLKIKR